MKKLIQERKRMGQLAGLVKEGFGDERYETKCKVDLTYFRTKFNGKEIDYATAEDMRVSFLIDMEGRSWGIKNLSVYDVKGPSELEVELEYYLDERGDEHRTERVMVPMDWDKVVMTKDTELGHIGIAEVVRVTIGNDGQGNIVVQEIEVEYNSL
jgi:hypothetical protein